MYRLKIILAGFNLDYETIRDAQAANPDAESFTPETLSAAYARISRNPAPVNELRAAARTEVEKARRSNQSIVFDMGHSSIAEHAVFNIDVLEVSRLLVEEIEKFRLCSYTEKSQRYVLLQDDFVVPREIRAAGLAEIFTQTVKAQNEFYRRLYEGLLPWVLEQNRELASVAANRSMLEGWAKEDARYVLCLATEAQLGMTLNTRNLELMLRRLAAHPLDEAKEYSRQLYDVTRHIAPSLVRYTEATEYDCLTRENLREIAGTIIGEAASRSPEGPPEEVRIVWATPDADNRTAAALLHAASHLPLEKCLGIAASLSPADREALFKASFRCMKAWDTPLREFENVDLQFDLVVSASCFAQLKRHRMATLVSQDYDPALDITVPPSIAAIGMEKPFRQMLARTEETFETIRRTSPLAAPYILTNAHRKRVLMKMNARELYHIARLRADRHAQWDIRQVTEKMLAVARTVMPLTLMMAGGKDQFAELYGNHFPSA
ncbi:MAG TPA: FAD-dependent thymidylate synthase [Syntrophales bacterium]|nr:FAD-dependent thymidylate synthase [Syntrophales bacterium]